MSDPSPGNVYVSIILPCYNEQDHVADEVARLKQTPGDGLLWVGGSELAASFLDLGLLDELRFIVTPVLLGDGKTVFDGIKKRHSLRLLSTRTFRTGNVVAIYEPIS